MTGRTPAARHGFEKGWAMGIGISLFLIAVGAILRFAIADVWEGVALGTVGVILMIVGAVGLVVSLVYAAINRRRSTTVVRERDVP